MYFRLRVYFHTMYILLALYIATIFLATVIVQYVVFPPFHITDNYSSLSSDICQAKYHVCQTIMRYGLTDCQIKSLKD